MAVTRWNDLIVMSLPVYVPLYDICNPPVPVADQNRDHSLSLSVGPLFFTNLTQDLLDCLLLEAFPRRGCCALFKICSIDVS